MKARQDNSAAQLVAGHVKPPARTTGEPDAPGPDTQEVGPASPPRAADVGVSRDAIAAEAYALWAARGHRDGRDLDDWLEAEQRLGRVSKPNGDGSRLR